MRRLTESSPGRSRFRIKRVRRLSIVHSVLLCIPAVMMLLSVYNPQCEAEEPGGKTLARTEVESLIEKVGKTPPDWWDSVQLNYPETLDLAWPLKAPPPWNNQKNVGQYIWDMVNPNPGRWKEGVRLVHHLLALNKDDPAKVRRTMNVLGRMYHVLLEDWARAAFWWQKAGGDPLGLADCYWKLGNKDMAVEMLSGVGSDYTRHGSVIKLWADMGEIDTALRLAENKARVDRPDAAYLAAGDACRSTGKYEQALTYYGKVLDVPSPEDKKEFTENNKKRARSSIEAIKLFDILDPSRIPDGTYSDKSMGYNAEIHVDVRVEDGRIESVEVTRHREKQFYSAINDTTKQIVEKQGVKGVDATTAATITSDAIINAAAKALASGMK